MKNRLGLAVVLLLAVTINRSTQAEMTIYEYKPELFFINYTHTERNVYNLLKKNPLKASVTYLAVPWGEFITKSETMEQELQDALAFLEPKKQLLQGGFTVCRHVKFRRILPLLKRLGIAVLFSPHALKDETYEGIKILPLAHDAHNDMKYQENKDIWYSFVGYRVHSVRGKIFELPVPKDCVVIERTAAFFASNFDKNEKENARKEYQDILGRSRFSLCPRGAGPGTFRFWESLQAGAIPVLIADKVALPEGVDWQECMVQIPEKNVKKISAILSKISPEQEQRMRKKCLEAFAHFSGDNFVSNIRLYYDKAL